jgi:hypothetical protein
MTRSLWPKDGIGRCLTLLGAMLCLECSSRLWQAGFPARNNEDRALLQFLCILDLGFGLLLIFDKRHLAVISWLVVPAWTITFGRLAWQSPQESLISFPPLPGIPPAWVTFGIGASFWALVIFLVRLRSPSNHTV